MTTIRRLRPSAGGLLLLIPLLVAAAACDDDDDPIAPPDTTAFTLRIENVSPTFDFHVSGAFDTPVGAGAPGPLLPGGAYEFSFPAPPGAALSFATMFVPSNDFFFAPEAGGIPLWNADGSPVSGDVTDRVALWDAGTEVNQEPGAGPDQVQRQAGPDTGAPDPDASVRRAPDTYGNLPATEDVLRVTFTPGADGTFTARIENVSTGTTLSTSGGDSQPVPLSPGVWVVHTGGEPLFTAGAPDRDEGLEAIAEDGAVATLAGELDDRTGLTVPLSPGVWVVHRNPDPLFGEGQSDRGLGLEAIAEDGSPGALATALTGAGVVASGAFDTPEGAGGPGPLTPGGTYAVALEASPADRLSFATMFVPSNDLFFAPEGAGIALFDAAGAPRSGEVTAEVLLWDAGTEINERPGFGPHQVQFQAGADTGPDENGTVRRIGDVADGFSYPATATVLRVTLAPAG